ncbi:hypothetical protein WFJ45_22910, partial [Salmonella enterica subsp. enterica serovar Minnesota]|uniref:hypothetical protein n=1 Tax=Salmonella enterica TaxID=28901 RepID=UPI003D2DBC6C
DAAPHAYVTTAATPGIRKVAPPPGVTLTDLSLNESSFGPSPRAVAAAPDTQLDLKLRGIFALDDPKAGHAIIADS